MAFVKLPPRLRSAELRRPEGGVARVDFSVFAGEVIRDQRAKRSGAARWTIRSSRQEQTFDFLELPIRTRPNAVAGVVAAIPADAETGPIVAVADVDSDQRVDFLHREAELLTLLSGYSVDYRRWRPSFGLALWTLMGGLLVGAFVFIAASFALGGAALSQLELLSALGLAALSGEPSALSALAAELGSVAHGIASAAHPAGLAATVAAAVAVLHGVTWRWAQARRRARFQSALLERVWRGAGETLGFVQDNADAFRDQSAEALEPPFAAQSAMTPKAAGRRRNSGHPQPSYPAPPSFLLGERGPRPRMS